MPAYIKKFLAIICLVSMVNCLWAQHAFDREVFVFKELDKKEQPPTGSILFTGSSSFTKWNNVQNDFPEHTILNRAFGGSCITDLIYFANEVILPYKPKQIVIYCGDNDLASSDTVLAVEVRNRFVQLFNIIRKNLPQTHILFVSIKPSPRREMLMPKMMAANALIKNFIKKQVKAGYVDVFNKMLLPNRKADPSIFLSDNLHMNQKGYAIWQNAIKPYLLKS